MAQDAEQTPEAVDAERKKGAAELLVLSLLEERQRHGYELAQLIERRRRFYELTAVGKRALAQEQRQWRALVTAVERITDFADAPDLAPEPGVA